MAVSEPKDVGRIECGSGSTKREGPWVVPHRMGNAHPSLFPYEPLPNICPEAGED